MGRILDHFMAWFPAYIFILGICIVIIVTIIGSAQVDRENNYCASHLNATTPPKQSAGLLPGFFECCIIRDGYITTDCRAVNLSEVHP